MNKIRTRDDYLRIFPKIIGKIKYSLIDWDLNDIKRASSGGAKMGVFILGSCYVDHLSCFYFGQESTRTNYINFVNKFLPMYNGAEFYKSMRCKLVHNYSVDGKYAFTHNNYGLHHKVDNDGKMLINLKSFINELEGASNELFRLLGSDQELQINFAKRYLDAGILQPVEVDIESKHT